MDNYQGDLTDIVRASGGALAQSHDNGLVSNWEFPSDPLNLSSSSSSAMDDSNVFGDPFCNMRDPLLHELNVAGSCYFGSPSNSTDHMLSTSVDDTTSFSGANCTNNDTNTNHLLAHHKVFEDDQMNKSPCDIFSRIQISQNNPTKLPVSPCDSQVIAVAAASSPQGFNASSIVSIDMINTNSSKACLIDNTPPLQISSPRNLGIKRRKSQAKKVVCIPAPASANGRPSGEVVPSDLWAWRKYGQKPIKGSPYPRGYYRCSSSKGCSARKQVERSRTDPNMLVITYTSEHNHPWPTQRNALAGSTRSQPHKSIAASKSSRTSQPQNKTENTKEEQESSNDTHEQLLSPTMAAAASSTASAAVKEEIEDIEKQIEMDDAENQFSTEGYPYRPTMPDSNYNQSEDFFADLGEIEADALDLLFSHGGFSGDPDKKESKILDPFSLFDWSGDNNNIINNSISFGEEEVKRGL